MASSRLSRLALVLVLAAATAAAQAPTRVRGKITAVDGDTIAVDGKARVRIGDKTEIVYTQPLAGWHESSVQASSSLQFGGGPLTQAPLPQVSFVVHASPSLQGVPSARDGSLHAPVVGLQTPASWH